MRAALRRLYSWLCVVSMLGAGRAFTGDAVSGQERP